MKVLHFVVLILLLGSCRNRKENKGIEFDSDTNNYWRIGWGAIIKIDSSCEGYPVLIKTDADFGPLKGFGFTDNGEFWAYDVPDSVKVVGEYYGFYFSPIKNGQWKRCGTQLRINQVHTTRIDQVGHFDHLEVIKVSDTCPNRVFVRVNFSYSVDGQSLDYAWCGNLPDSLKAVGTRFYASVTYAGINANKECNDFYPYRVILVDRIERQKF